jgi:hypothetical protein
MCWEPASPAVMLITWLSEMGTGAENGMVTVLFSSFAEQEEGDLPRHDAGRETARFVSTSSTRQHWSRRLSPLALSTTTPSLASRTKIRILSSQPRQTPRGASAHALGTPRRGGKRAPHGPTTSHHRIRRHPHRRSPHPGPRPPDRPGAVAGPHGKNPIPHRWPGLHLLLQISL